MLRRWASALAMLATVLPCSVAARASDPPPPAALTAADYRKEDVLAALLWARSPDVGEARRAVGLAASEVTRARLYPNPALDLLWDRIPIGATNPPRLDDPLGNVPLYGVAISQLVEVAKRGPRQAAAVAELESSKAQALAVFSDRYFLLLDAVGTIARNQLRASVLGSQAESTQTLLALDRGRAATGEIAALDADRTAVEASRLRAARDRALTDVEVARATCSTIVGTACPPLPTGDEAQAILHEQAAAELPREWSAAIEARRPDLAALHATLRAADQRAVLAQRRVIPDPTFRFGYDYDTYVTGGNQRQSLGIGVSVPLPVLDRGQADLEAATAILTRTAEIRDSLVTSGRSTLELDTRQRDLLRDRRGRLEEALAQARSVRDGTQGAARAGGASQVDVLLARRAYEDLLLDLVDLDGDAYEAALRVRKVTASFPRPAAADTGGRP